MKRKRIWPLLAIQWSITITLVVVAATWTSPLFAFGALISLVEAFVTALVIVYLRETRR